MQRDSTLYTFTVALVLCIACSLLVSGAAVLLSKQQNINKEIDRKKNILLAAGLCEPGASAKEVDDIFGKRIRETLVDLDTGKPVNEAEVNVASYDPRKAAKDPLMNQPVEPNSALMGISKREPYASVYQIVDESEQLEGYILPVYGKGLWSTLYGFIALQEDRQTVLGITFYEHAETPGLGGEVDNPNWKKQWPGKVALDDGGEVEIQVIKGKMGSDDPAAKNTVDGLSGATITTKGVNGLVRYWLGPEGFGPYLANQGGGASHDHDGHGHGDHDSKDHDHDAKPKPEQSASIR